MDRVLIYHDSQNDYILANILPYDVGLLRYAVSMITNGKAFASRRLFKRVVRRKSAGTRVVFTEDPREMIANTRYTR